MSDPSGHRFTTTHDDDDQMIGDGIGSHHTTTSIIGANAASSTSTPTTITNKAHTSRSDNYAVLPSRPSQKNPSTTATPLTLPDGRIIDGKNTLQSFDGNNGGGGGGDVEIRKNHMPHVPQAPVCTLPDGRLIDGKNTLQSFDGDGMTNNTSGAGGGGIGTTHTLPCKEPALTLPDGRLINGKNTLQSFVASSLYTCPPSSNYPHDGNVGLTTTKHITSRAGADVVGSIISTTAHAFAVAERQQPTVDHIMSTNHYSAGNANVAEATIHAEPVAVVDAEIAEPQIESSFQQKKSSTWYCLLMTLVVVAISAATAIGAYCGNGNCGSSPPSPVVSPTTMIPKTPLMVACDFVNTQDINECQKIDSFSISGRFVYTTIPTELGLLTQLTKLELTQNQFNSTIPSSLGNLIRLNWLDLGDNRLTGNIPSALGNLWGLKYLGLYKNRLTGTIPSAVGDMTELLALYLSNNQLTGSLLALYLSNNQLTGSIPLTLNKLTQLFYLNLNGNKFAGSIPSMIGNLMELSSLSLYNNQCNGTIPSTMGNLINLANLSLASNQLSGTIPSSFEKLTQLKYLGLYNNSQLTGTIPSVLCSNSEIGIQINCTNVSCTCCIDSSDRRCPTI